MVQLWHSYTTTIILRRKYQSRPSIINHCKLCVAEEKLQTSILKANDQYLAEITQNYKKTQRKLSAHLSSLANVKVSPDYFIIHNSPTYDLQQIADSFSQFFIQLSPNQVALSYRLCMKCQHPHLNSVD